MLELPVQVVTWSLIVAVAVITEVPTELPVAKAVKPLSGVLSVEGGFTVA
jgi:hypothetical protein